MDAAWPVFYYDSNHAFLLVENGEDWDKVKRAHLSLPGWDLDKLLDDYPKFGIRSECTGPKTLRDHFTAHGVTP